MRKLNSIILLCVLIFTTLSGCGMPGPLYQEAQGNQDNKAVEKNKQTKSGK